MRADAVLAVLSVPGWVTVTVTSRPDGAPEVRAERRVVGASGLCSNPPAARDAVGLSGSLGARVRRNRYQRPKAKASVAR